MKGLGEGVGWDWNELTDWEKGSVGIGMSERIGGSSRLELE